MMNGGMVVNQGVNEDLLVEVILLAISENLDESHFEDDSFGDTKITKVVYDVSNNLKLPITRSWYKFGTYVWSPICKKTNLELFYKNEIPGTRKEVIIQYLERITGIDYLTVLTEVQKHAFMHDKTLNEFLNNLYSHYAPKGTRNLYKTHKKFIDRILHIYRDLPTALYPEPQYLLLSSELTDFHKEIVKFSDDPISDIVIDYTTHFEEIAMKIDNSLDDGIALTRICRHLESVYKKYIDDIWTLPASQIAEQTLDGPYAEIKKSECREIVNSAINRQIIVDEVRNNTINLNLFPTKYEIMSCQKRIKNNLSVDPAVANQLFINHLR